VLQKQMNSCLVRDWHTPSLDVPALPPPPPPVPRPAVRNLPGIVAAAKPEDSTPGGGEPSGNSRLEGGGLEGTSAAAVPVPAATAASATAPADGASSSSQWRGAQQWLDATSGWRDTSWRRNRQDWFEHLSGAVPASASASASSGLSATATVTGAQEVEAVTVTDAKDKGGESGGAGGGDRRHGDDDDAGLAGHGTTMPASSASASAASASSVPPTGEETSCPQR
jgi:hypothetical protein